MSPKNIKWVAERPKVFWLWWTTLLTITALSLLAFISPVYVMPIPFLSMMLIGSIDVEFTRWRWRPPVPLSEDREI